MTSIGDDELLLEAQRARRSAHAPYSRFQVGAALLTVDGEVFPGCNVENVSYGLSVCAERTAVFSAVASGARDFAAMALVTDAPDPVPPCGACLQVLAEFGDGLRVISEARGKRKSWSLDELLPERFDGMPMRRSDP